VVVDHVEHDLEPHRVKRPDELAELGVLVAHRAAVRVGVVAREKADRVVAPVVALPRVELEHRHQLDHRHAELDQVRDLVDQAREGPAPVLGHPGGRMGGKAAHVELVDHRVGLVPAPPVVAPVEALAIGRDQPEWRAPGIRARLARRSTVEARGEVQRACVGIEQDLVRVEAMAR
jgi:hypothetical protein